MNSPAQRENVTGVVVRAEDLRERCRSPLESLSLLERYHDALVAIRDGSTDPVAVALASNVLMGLQPDFGFLIFPARPEQ